MPYSYATTPFTSTSSTIAIISTFTTGRTKGDNQEDDSTSQLHVVYVRNAVDLNLTKVRLF
jgi:hypothetical protein